MRKIEEFFLRTVRGAKALTSDEKLLWFEISENLDNAGCCKLQNLELAKIFGVSIQTISARIADMQRKGYLRITYETRNHARRLYPTWPDEVDEALPTEEEKQLKLEKLKQAYQKGIKLTDAYFSALIQKLRYSPILDELKDNSTQFALSLEQIEFLAKFMALCPDKDIDLQLSSIVQPIGYEWILDSIKASAFIRKNKNLSLKWIIDNYHDIILNKYADYRVHPEAKGRVYTREELNDLILTVDEIEI